MAPQQPAALRARKAQVHPKGLEARKVLPRLRFQLLQVLPNDCLTY